jgi:hypothetical protein
MNESTVELEQTEDEMFTDKVPDEALEGRRLRHDGGITFTLSIHPLKELQTVSTSYPWG